MNGGYERMNVFIGLFGLGSSDITQKEGGSMCLKYLTYLVVILSYISISF